jgi:hypothetical protein
MASRFRTHSDRLPTVERSSADSNKSTSRFRRLSLRVLFIAALLGVAYIAGGRMAEWRAPTQPAVVATPAAAAAFMPLSGVMLQSGGWTFAGQEWDVSTLTVDTKAVEARLNELRQSTTASPASCPDVPREILRVIETLHLQPVEVSGNLLYKVEKPNFKAQLLACNVEGVLKVVTFAIAYPGSAQKWQLLEGRPNGKLSGANENASHLLPLTDSGKRIASRFADDGQLLLEVIKLSSNADELTIKWREAGWEVRPSGLGSTSAFSVLCGRGSDVVYAWSSDPRESLRTLMLVRSPTDAEMQAQGLAPTN